MRHAPSEEDDARYEVIARNVAARFPEEGTTDFDILYYLSEDESYEEIAKATKISLNNLPARIAYLFGKQRLDIPFSPRSPETRAILNLVFEMI